MSFLKEVEEDETHRRGDSDGKTGIDLYEAARGQRIPAAMKTWKEQGVSFPFRVFGQSAALSVP